MKDLASISASANAPRYGNIRSPRKTANVICTCTHFSARDLLLAAGPELEANSVDSNLILPDALDRQVFEGHGGEVPSFEDSRVWWDVYPKQTEKRASLMKSSPRSEDVEPAISEVVYISIWTLRQDRRTLDFVVACAGHKPIFVFSNHSSSGLTAAFLELRIPHLAESMKKVIPDRRVFAIVGIETVAERLAAAWEALTGHRIKQPAYYQATHTFCTRQTLAPLTASDVGMCRMGLATEGHILQAGRLCSAFTQSAHDDPYQLSVQQGIQEAKRLIQRKELYVCDVLRGGRADDYDVVCIIAVTRKSTKVAAVSKVFTHENYRRRGYAKRLLAHVCHEVLRTKQQIVLFVAHDLKTAAGVYGRVGFVGVGDRPMSERALVERWLELGFEDTDTGHW